MSKLSIMAEFWEFLKVRKKWWLTPIIVILLLLMAVILLGESTPLGMAIYTLF